MKTNPVSAAHRLRAHYRWLRSVWSLVILAFGFGVILVLGWWRHPSWSRLEDQAALLNWWAGGVALTFLAAAVVWFFRRQNMLHSAQKWDDRLLAKNRLETAAALRDDSSAVAQAQREETAQFLDRAPVRARDGAWPALASLIAMLLLAHFVTLISWTRPWIRPVKMAAAVPPPAPVPKATIKWKTPAAETKAAPIEEVPLTAVADSTSGLRDLVLEMEVNGEPRLQTPVALDELKMAGAHAIQTSIYLDQLDVQPYDMVSYHLRARRLDARSLPETVSPVQFVQVKPFRDDVREMKGGGEGQPGFALVTALKAVQLRLIKENFLLAHADLAHDHADWKSENLRVGDQQDLLEKKTGEGRQKLIDLGTPAEIVNLISQAQPLMAEAARKIRATENQPAVEPQSKALALLTEVEKFFIKMIATGGSARPGPRNISDPFKDKKQLELKQRFQTQAGELELLVQEQMRLADDLAKPDAAALPTPDPSTKPDPNKIEGTLAERQTQVSQRVGALLNGKVFLSEVTKHLEEARNQARASLQRLDGSDVPAAREPAAMAARELQMASDAMNKAGEDQAKDDLAEALRVLNGAADQARSAPAQKSDQVAKNQVEEATQQARETAAKLAEAAQKQQETGSEKAAQQLNDLAKGLAADNLRKALEGLRQQPRNATRAENAANQLQQLADRAAQKPGALSPEELAHLIDRLERAQANMRRLVANAAHAEPDQQPALEKNLGQEKGEGSGKDEPTGKQAPGKDEASGQSPGQQVQRGRPAGETPSQGEGAENGMNGASGNSGGQGAAGDATSQGAHEPEREAEPKAPASAKTRQMQEQFAQDLLEEVREAAQEASSELPASSEAAAVRAAARPAAARTHYAEILKVFTRIDPPLQGVINALCAEAGSARRQHQLAEQNPDLAPPAYRSAVADYFEQLSRDYQAAPAPRASPDAEKK